MNYEKSIIDGKQFTMIDIITVLQNKSRKKNVITVVNSSNKTNS